MSDRLAAAAFISIIAGVVLVVCLNGPRRQLVTEAETSDLAATTAAGVAALAEALTPTRTPYLTSTATRTPKPATQTPQPTYGPEASPGWYVVPAWTEVPPVASTVKSDDQPFCRVVTAEPYADQPCRVGAP
jgi:hypothetical protein